MGVSTYQVDVSYACFGIDVDNKTGMVVDAAPIGRWMIGKHYVDVRFWVESKRGKLNLVRVG